MTLRREQVKSNGKGGTDWSVYTYYVHRDCSHKKIPLYLHSSAGWPQRRIVSYDLIRSTERVGGPVWTGDLAQIRRAL